MELEHQESSSATVGMSGSSNHKEAITTRGLSGLSNLGNTCYMNACLQTLSATKPLLAYLLYKKSPFIKQLKQKILDEIFIDCEKRLIKDDISISPKELRRRVRQRLPYKLRIIFKFMWAHNCEVEPKDFKKNINKQMPFFGGMRQHDSQEFLTMILDKIHEDTKGPATLTPNFSPGMTELMEKIKIMEDVIELAKKDHAIEMVKKGIDDMSLIIKNNQQDYCTVKSYLVWKELLSNSYSIINDIFSGMFMTETVCKVCNHEQYTFERFDVFMLHLPEEISKEAEKYTLYDLMGSYVTPEVLKERNMCLCDFCGVKTESTKQHRIYQQPNTLVIMIKKYQKFMGNIIKSNIKIEYDHEIDISPYVTKYSQGNMKYELYAVIRHSGGMGGGHYYSYTKSPINGLWYLYDDGDVFHVDSAEPLNCNGYVLFYRKKE
jgi:ubiquitin C-terminal hydrolase